MGRMGQCLMIYRIYFIYMYWFFQREREENAEQLFWVRPIDPATHHKRTPTFTKTQKIAQGIKLRYSNFSQVFQITQLRPKIGRIFEYSQTLNTPDLKIPKYQNTKNKKVKLKKNPKSLDIFLPLTQKLFS
jgi:hypothetical protein